MSFSNKVKAELASELNSRIHCRTAEMAAIIGMCGDVSISQFDRYTIKIISENIFLVKKIYLLLKKTYNIIPEVALRSYGNKESVRKDSGRKYAIVIRDHNVCMRILKDTELIDRQMEIGEQFSDEKHSIIARACCKRAFLRGSFLATGYIRDPDKAYHLEIVCNSGKKSEQLVQILQTFEIEAKTVARKGYFVVYIKEGQEIVNVLNVIGAHVSLMEFENMRIVREMRGGLNRQNNCEVANINKTVVSSLRQREAIEYIRTNMGLKKLPKSLQEIAYIRLENPDTPLAELGEMLSKPIGKSGVNHRLRKICEIADELRTTYNKED